MVDFITLFFKSVWDEAKHPRVPKGMPGGGRFTSGRRSLSDESERAWEDYIHRLEHSGLRAAMVSLREKHRAAMQEADLETRRRLLAGVAVEGYKAVRSLFPRDVDLFDRFYSIISRDINDTSRMIREARGEPELTADNPESVGRWLEWAERSGISDRMRLINIASALHRIDELPYERQREQEVQLARDKLTGEAFRLAGIDRSKLREPERWDVFSSDILSRSTEHPVSYLHFKKRFDYQHDNGELSSITFYLNPTGGISILSEVADEGIPLEVQARELHNFLTDVRDKFPKGWNKKVGFVEGGDIAALIEGKVDDYITVCREMSPREYELWTKGAEVPSGKFFATDARWAKGTDFGSEGWRQVYWFRVPRSAMRGVESGVLRTATTLRYSNGKLFPAAGSERELASSHAEKIPALVASLKEESEKEGWR